MPQNALYRVSFKKDPGARYKLRACSCWPIALYSVDEYGALKDFYPEC